MYKPNTFLRILFPGLLLMFSLPLSLSSRIFSTAIAAGSLSLVSIASSSIIAPCSTSAWGNSSQTHTRTVKFGRDGRAGRNGTNGRSGASGSSQTIYVNGASRTPIELDLAGRDGETGTDGEDADPPRCQRQPRKVRHNLQAAVGAHGGSAGHGGSGGDGGQLTIHYQDIADLRQVLVDAGGGRGSRGGRGGLGRNGCDCVRPSWTVEICSDGSCYNETYICTDGGDGKNGYDGEDGIAGETGQLVLIDRLTPLPTEQPSQSVSFSQLAKQPAELSRHIWETRNGAKSLLASGSAIKDSYYAYQETVERQFSLDWQANLEGDRFNDEVTLSLDENGEVDIDFPEDYWLLGETVESGTQMTYRVNGILPIDEVAQLAFGRIEGRSRTFEVEVIDRAQLSDEVDTRFELRYSTSNDEGRRYTVQYEGAVDGEFVERDRNRFRLALGRLPIRSQLMSGGTEARVELSVIRSYGNNTTTQDLRWSGRL